jgi:hypothetical protein
MEQKTIKRFPAQLPPPLHQWASSKAKELDIPIAAVWRGLAPMIREAERAGIQLQPVQQPEHQAQP